MARTPGPAPKNPDERLRRNPDPKVGDDGWTLVRPDGRVTNVPDVPAWLQGMVGPVTTAFYLELAQLPQATTWGPGDWLMLHASLPLLDRYFTRPGSESYKAWTAVLDPGLRITSDAMQKARLRIDTKGARPENRTGEQQQPTTSGVTSLQDAQARRARLTGA